MLRAWMISKIPDGAKDMNKLICGGKTLRGSKIETEDCNNGYGLRSTGRRWLPITRWATPSWAT